MRDLKKYWAELSNDKPYPTENIYRHIIVEAKEYRKLYLNMFDMVRSYRLPKKVSYVGTLEDVIQGVRWLSEALIEILKAMSFFVKRDRRRMINLIEIVEHELVEIKNIYKIVRKDSVLLSSHLLWYMKGWVFLNIPIVDSSYYKAHMN